MSDIYNWPSDLIPNENEFYLESVTRQFKSTFTGSSQTLEFPGSRWVVSMKFKNLTRDKMRRLEVFLLQLRGAANRVRIPDHAVKMSGLGGSATVDGGEQIGRVLMIKGAPASSNYLLTGDYFEVNGELKRVIADANTDSNGKTSVRFEPALRSPPPNNSEIITRSPSATVRLDKDDGGRVKRVPQFGSVALKFVEDINR